MVKRKVSCLPCRLKKVKCDGEKPCQRCQARQVSCAYQKPKIVGRPPKNAVVNKLVLSRLATDPSITSTVCSSTACKEFIFENISMTPLIASTRYLYGSNNYNLDYFINNLFSLYFSEATSLGNFIKGTKKEQQVCKVAYTSTPKVKVSDLDYTLSFFISDTCNILMRRTSRLKLSFYEDLSFSTVALIHDYSEVFFDTPVDNSLVMNPLNSLSPQHAVRLIENFFAIHHYSFILNKTLLLQSFWTDTADPLLLSVIYGTTIFMSQLLDGKPLELWDALNGKKRNPFLNYAHILLSKVSAEVTPSRYQAVVLLALFEVMFGFPKKGTALFGVSFLIAARLGILDNTMPQGLTEIEKELLLSTFWSAFQCTMRGSVEMEDIPRAALSVQLHSYPPVNMRLSKSYQFDVENNNPRLYRTYNYIVETLFVSSVVSRVSCEIMLALPQEYRTKTSGTPDFIKKHLEIKSAPNTVPKLVETQNNIKRILDNFGSFIEQNSSSVSTLQKYTLEIVRLFFKICLEFLGESILEPKSKKFPFSVHRGRIPAPLDLTDVSNILAIQKALPDAFLLIDKTSIHLNDPQNFALQPDFLPRGIIISGLDAAAQVLMYSYRLEQTHATRQHLELAEEILSSPIIRLNWESAGVVKADITNFLATYPSMLFDHYFENKSNSSTDHTDISSNAILSSLDSLCNPNDYLTSFVQQNQAFDYIPTVSLDPWLMQGMDCLQEVNQVVEQTSSNLPTCDQNQEETILSEQELNTILTSLL
ncbi:hypothetical protein EDC96DRAFT_504089 [Choanephora cucurbitarum]|nr:hypothetical protein EDC96DRAFT_504089 [Choanephora cucurbitarum]